VTRDSRRGDERGMVTEPGSGPERVPPMFKRRLRFQLRSTDQLLFIHCPKTAGTTFFTLLSAHYPSGEIYRSQAGRLQDALQEHGWPVVARYRLMRAHYDTSITRFFPRRPVCVTMLRDPVERIISYYEHVRRSPNHKHHRRVIEGKMSLAQFMDPPLARSDTSNFQVRQLAGAIRGPARGLPDSVLLEIARVNLEECAYFGITERFDESLSLLHFTFGWRSIEAYENLNVSPTPTRRGDHQDEVIAKIEEANVLDVQLYRHARRVFGERLKQSEEELRIAPTERKARGRFFIYRKPRQQPFHPQGKSRLRGLVVWLGKARRLAVPEGSRLEETYLRLRSKLFGW
jgi:hypothetical protein